MSDDTKPARKPKAKSVDPHAEALSAIAEMPEPDRAIAEQLRDIIAAAAPELTLGLWYNMPAWALSDGKVVCFFQSAQKFKTRYGTLGFQHAAKLDDGRMWPVAFALTEITDAEAERIAALVRKAAG